MKDQTTSTFLLKPIQQMDVSKEFKLMAKTNGYRTMQDVLHCSVYDLPKKKNSGYRMVRELLDLLEENNLMSLMEE